MKLDNKLIDELEAQYGCMLPTFVLRGMVKPKSRLDYVREKYVYDPVSKRIYNKRTGRAQRNKLVSCGVHHSPVALHRAEWFLRMGDDPLRVMGGRDGLRAVYHEGGPKVLAR